MIRSEPVFGDEFRSFTLPLEVDESKAETKYEYGILTLPQPEKTGTVGWKPTVQ